MKRVRTVLLPTMLVILVVGLSGCTALDYGTVKAEPSTVRQGEQQTVSLIFTSFEPTTVTVSSIDYELYHDERIASQGTYDPKTSGWKTGSVPPFQEVVIWSWTGRMTLIVGSWELRVIFHTSEGDFPATGGWTVLP